MRNIDFVKRYVRYCWTWQGKISGRHSNLSYRVVGKSTVLYSYRTPIAEYYNGVGFLVASNPRSLTTARHREIYQSFHLPKVDIYDPEEDDYADNEPSQMQAL
jgi:hypothetical protein